MSKLRDRIAQLLKSELSLPNEDAACRKSNAELESLNGELATIKANMAPAKTAEHYKLISEEYDLLESWITSLRKKSEALQSRTHIRSGLAKEIDSAMDFFHHIRQTSESNCDYALLAKLFAETNALLFLKFKEVVKLL